MKIEGVLYGLGLVVVVAGILLFFQKQSFSLLMNTVVSGLLLIGFGKLLMMVEHYGEKNLEQLTRISDELSRRRQDN